MGLSLTAVKISLSGAWSEQEGGMILTSDPVSTRKRVSVILSVM